MKTILHDTSGNGNWDSLYSVRFGTIAWTDINSPVNMTNNRNLVEVFAPNVCSATKSTVDYNSSRSNVKQSASPGSVKELSLENTITIYPNPNDGTFTIELRTSDFGLPASISIYNVQVVTEKIKFNQTIIME